MLHRVQGLYSRRAKDLEMLLESRSCKPPEMCRIEEA